MSSFDSSFSLLFVVFISFSCDGESEEIWTWVLGLFGNFGGVPESFLESGSFF